MGNTIYAAFADAEHAEKAAGALLDHGIQSKDLSVVRGHPSVGPYSDAYEAGEPLAASGVDPIERIHPDRIDNAGDIEASAKHGISTTSAADAGAGAVKGAAWGVGVGAIAALASLIIPGVGLVLGGGALAAGLGGVAMSAGAGAVAGAVTGYLKDQGVDENAALKYTDTINSGGALLALSVPSGSVDEASAREILTKYGATSLDAFAIRSHGSGYAI